MKNIRNIVILLFFCRSILIQAAGEYRERVYLQTDKQVYLAGELVWLKMYVTDPDGKPSPLSKVGYVELLDEESDLLQVKVELKDGTGPGWLELPITLPTGNYRLVGYTQYMRNEGEDVYFNKEISIINTFRTDKTVRIISSDLKEDGTTVKPVSTIAVSTDKTDYPVRSEVKVTLSRLPANLESVAISVAGTDLPTGFSPSSIQAWRNQLLVMSKPTFSGEYIPEYEGHIIKGKIVPLESGKEVINDHIIGLLGFPGDDIRLFAVQANKNPEVQFYTAFNRGRHEIVTTTLSASSTLYRLDIQSPFVSHTPRQLSPFALRSGWEKELQERSVGLQLQHMFTGDSLSRIWPTQTWFRTKPDWKYDFDEYTRFSTMEEVVIEFLLPLRFRRINGKRTLSVLKEDRQGFTYGNSMILLDGIPLVDHELLFNYDPFSLKRVEVYSGHFVFGGQMFDGIASFYTFRNDYPGLVLDPSSQLFDYEGTQEYRYFYMPDYRIAENRNNYLPDARHTLLWNPELQTGGAPTVDLSFYTSDLTGEFTVTVEGITKDGKSVYATHTLQVR